MTLQLLRYQPDDKKRWDEFVHSSKNATFLFYRDFMDYHSDRFDDHSLLFLENNKILALLPANECQSGSAQAHIRSHGGLSYGGVLCDKRMGAQTMLDIFELMINYYHQHGFASLIYKPIPHIYHRYPAEEEIYALFRYDAQLIQVDNSTTIYQGERLPFAKGKKCGVKKAQKHQVTCVHHTTPSALEAFFQLLQTTLQERHDTSATHSFDEMRQLHASFPDQIRLHSAYEGDTMIAGSLVFNCDTVAHTQYLATSARGREIGALDLLLFEMISDVYANKRYFNFGISNEANGSILNSGLCRQKEMLGGRSTVQSVFHLVL